MEVTNFLNSVAIGIIHKMNNEFDSHDFIMQLIKDHERKYVELLYSYKNSSGIFRAFHQQIGIYLSKNANSLSIIKIRQDFSENIKDYDSKNQKWSKIL
ncbi:MAG: hypothetical protein WCL51_18440 [Bacteroidota bacterium]